MRRTSETIQLSGVMNMDEIKEMEGLRPRIREAYITAAPYLSDHPNILHLLMDGALLDDNELIRSLEERERVSLPPERTDIRIMLNALANVSCSGP